MKVRIKFNSQSHCVDLGDRPASALTLTDLIQAVASTLQLNAEDFNLSLNQNDFLSGNNKLLSDFDIVAGDLVYVLRSGEIEDNASKQNAPQRSQLLSSWPPSSSSSTMNNLAQPVNEDNESSASFTTGTKTMAEERAVNPSDSSPNIGGSIASQGSASQSQVNRFLLEPLTVRESTGEQVPALLDQLYASSQWTGKSEVLWVVLHTLMIESGFFPAEHEEQTSMPDNWKQRGFYSCSYDYVVRSNLVLQCTVVGVTIGSSISVHGVSKGNSDFKTESLQLKPDHFVGTLKSEAAPSYRAMDHLSRLFKDVICMPLINHLTRSAGLGDEHGLMALPCELRIRLMTYLDAKSVCRLGAVCTHWNSIYKDSIVWRRLYLRCFHALDDCSLGRNWFDLYKEKQIAQRDEEERRRRAFQFREDYPPRRPFMPPPMFGPGGRDPFFPHVIGGGYDLNPEFASGIVNPMGRGLAFRPGLGLRHPMTLDSSDIFARGPRFPGRTGRGRSSYTGNPFQHF